MIFDELSSLTCSLDNRSSLADDVPVMFSLGVWRHIKSFCHRKLHCPDGVDE
jgi:hypothetical protein